MFQAGVPGPGETFVLLAYQADAICLQEIRTRAEPVILEGYRHYWHHSIRDKYSGTAMLLREEPLRVYVRELLSDKLVVSCGDIHGARVCIDFYPETMRLYWAEQG